MESLLFRAGLQVKRKGGKYPAQPVDANANEADGELTLLPFESLLVFVFGFFLFLISSAVYFRYISGSCSFYWLTSLTEGNANDMFGEDRLCCEYVIQCNGNTLINLALF